MLKDSHNRVIDYMRISVTDRCNLRCVYCMPNKKYIKNTQSNLLSIEELTTISKIAILSGIKKIRLTGGEPLVRKGIIDYIKEISKISELKELTLTTNGSLLPHFAKDLKKYGINRINISLDALDPDVFFEITGGGILKETMDGIISAREADFKPIKINTVLMKGINDKYTSDILKLLEDGLVDEVRFIELMPIGETASRHDLLFVPVQDIINKHDLKPTQKSNITSVADSYLFKGKYKVGLISPISHKFCSGCNKIRLTADGRIKLCLLSDAEIDIKPVIGDGSTLESTLRNLITNKPLSYRNACDCKTRNMINIGG